MNTTKSMGIIIQAEEAAITALAIYGLTRINLQLPLWTWVILFFAPDISMLGYLINTCIGAIVYNLFHHRAVAAAVIIAGLLLQNQIAIASGLLLFAHSSFDRMLGIGLKYPDSFKHTHLGRMQ